MLPQENLANKIFAVTELIQRKFPELYRHLSETPLFLSYTEKELGIADFEQYLESLKTQLAAFEKMSSLSTAKDINHTVSG